MPTPRNINSERLPQTAEILCTLKNLKKVGTRANLISSPIIRKLYNLLSDIEKCGLPYPTVKPQPTGGVILEWLSEKRDMMLEISDKGRMQFYAVTKIFDIHGDLDPEHLQVRDGVIKDMRGMDHLFAWYLTPSCCQA